MAWSVPFLLKDNDHLMTSKQISVLEVSCFLILAALSRFVACCHLALVRSLALQV